MTKQIIHRDNRRSRVDVYHLYDRAILTELKASDGLDGKDLVGTGSRFTATVLVAGTFGSGGTGAATAGFDAGFATGIGGLASGFTAVAAGTTF